ncbi:MULTISPECIES: carbon-nitrogen hydrolase family protein [Delftia]|uniref:Carbon-nitrogen hydrolase family protein n=1 Tax=Delftia acidovorans TaxID=80866 RepID=A0A7T2RZQ0_DELAC|nr:MULTISPECIES: carbon-nitrogen hydrolase family protein [Delftia]MBB1652646.1 acyltransferase [Delftia sp. UME58]QPS06349.1 carbon-nitrogen hydrolase family protein [Delftia acidovorans]
MKIAALQMVSEPDVRANLDQALALLRQAREQGAELAALPEYFCAMGLRDTDKLAYRESFGAGPIQDFLRRAARELQLWIVGGTLPLVADDDAHVLNSSLVFSPQGECVARYDKIHLFHYDNGRERYTEAAVVQAGHTPVTCDITSHEGESWRLGLSVCYDLRFPELYRRLAEQGADLLLVPAAFTHITGLAHWEVLLRARAIENQAYLLAPAQGGHHENGRRTWGHSLLADPWGMVLAQQAEGAGVVLGEIRRERLAHVRRQLPALEHRVL